MAQLVPGDAPDPDGERRFAERAFPLLEPVGWTGERHRGGYGVRDPGGITTALGLIFGPWDPFVSEPRLAVTVGSSFPISVTDPHAPFVMGPRLLARRDELLRPPDRHERATLSKALVEIDGARVEVDVLRRQDRWIAHGRWDGYAVEIHAIRVDPASVRLQLAADLPER
jgi:hypothetical protein